MPYKRESRDLDARQAGPEAASRRLSGRVRRGTTLPLPFRERAGVRGLFAGWDAVSAAKPLEGEGPNVCKNDVDSLFLFAVPLNKLDDAVFGPVDVFALT